MGRGRRCQRKAGEVGLGGIGGVDADQMFSPQSEELKIAGRFHDHQFDFGHVEIQVCILDWLIHGEAANV